jgi:valyl-tRNA synthetase
MVSAVTDDARLYMPMAELVDLDKERERIGKELEKARDNLKRIEGKLANEKFTANAPAAVVDAERERAAKARTLIENLENSLAALG